MKPIFLKSLLIIIPYILRVSLSSVVLPPSAVEEVTSTVSNDQQPLSADETPLSLSGLSFAIHRNGEPDPCGSTVNDFHTALISVIPDKWIPGGIGKDLEKLRKLNLTKHQVDALLTASFGKYLLSKSQCGPEQPPEGMKAHKAKAWGRGLNYKIKGVDSSFLTFCDMGEERTPILHDHNELVPVDSGHINTLPCHFHTREGLRITSLGQMFDLSNAVNQKNPQDCDEATEGDQTCKSSNMMHLYAVPAGRIFMFAPSYVGEIFRISHVHHPLNKEPVTLRVMSVSPKVFDVVDFFHPNESRAIVDKALKETSESHKIKRSSTGASGYNVNSQRTSENGFDTHGATAIEVKKRSLEVLGFDEYVESYTDGLQVLRYNKTTAYIPHMDWIDDPGKTNPHDYDSAKLGTNRFATVLLYMTDLNEGDGGETVFKNTWPEGLPAEERRERQDVLNELRKTGEVSFLKQGSWEETMVADCRSRLAVKPHAGRAVLFYSQFPNGEEDHSSTHGGCPVLHGEKWAANNWVWNGPRGGFQGSPKNKRFEGTQAEATDGQLKGFFRNTGNDPKFKNAKLFFQETEWGDFSSGKSHDVNTYHGHEWNVRDSNGNILKKWTVAQKPAKQDFIV